jgi:hypothetical protein
VGLRHMNQPRRFLGTAQVTSRVRRRPRQFRDELRQTGRCTAFSSPVHELPVPRSAMRSGKPGCWAASISALELSQPGCCTAVCLLRLSAR